LTHLGGKQLAIHHSLGWIFSKVMEVCIIYNGTVQEFILSLPEKNRQLLQYRFCSEANRINGYKQWQLLNGDREKHF
jgi:hypothetical protein